MAKITLTEDGVVRNFTEDVVDTPEVPAQVVAEPETESLDVTA